MLSPALRRRLSGLAVALCALWPTALVLSGCRSASGGTLEGAGQEQAEAAFVRGEWERSAALWNQVRQTERPPSARAQLRTAQSLAHLGQREDALALVEHGLVLFPEHADLLLARAEIQRDLGYRRAAERDAQAAAGRAPDRADAWMTLARLRLELESPTRAAEAAERAVALAPELVEARILAGRAWRGSGDEARAHVHYAAALATPQARSYDLLLEAASLHAVQGEACTQAVAALGWIEEALELAPSCPRASFVQGCLLERTGDGDRAIVAYRRAIEGDNFHLAAMTNLALLYAQRGQSDEARSMVDRILALDLEQDSARRRALRELVAR